MDKQIEELTADIYYLKMEINFPSKDLSQIELQKLSEDRLEKKRNLRRLMKLKDRKNKLLKIKDRM